MLFAQRPEVHAARILRERISERLKVRERLVDVDDLASGVNLFERRPCLKFTGSLIDLFERGEDFEFVLRETHGVSCCVACAAATATPSKSFATRARTAQSFASSKR